MQPRTPDYTVLGAKGFLGSLITASLESRGFSVATPRTYPDADLSGNLGRVIYAIGLTADFRSRPFDTIEAHTSLISRILRDASFDSLTYLSSCRVYNHASSTSEDSPIAVCPSRAGDLYDLSKLAGESICHHSGRGNVSIARLSNVVGVRKDKDLFIDQILHDARSKGVVHLASSPQTTKDYIYYADAVDAICLLAETRSSGCYNIASGDNTSHLTVLEGIREHFPFEWECISSAAPVTPPPINVAKLRSLGLPKARSFREFFPLYMRDYLSANP